MENICVIGSGYVGLVTATCFADLGNRVVTVDIDERKIETLKQGKMPIYEPGLEELVERNVKADRLHFTTSYTEGLKDADFVFICVGTPSAVDGEADLKYVRSAAQTIAETMQKPLIVVNKSTVPVGTGDWTAEIIRNAQPEPIEFAVVSCPEFLREGSAIADFMNPDRNVFGSTDREAAEQVARLYEALGSASVITDIRTAEMIKYASNAFLATRISFINEISIICERLGADVTEVARGMGFDKRIGPHFLSAGVGYGGSCFTADETIFALNSPNVVAERIEDLFNKVDTETIEGDVVTVKVPDRKCVLAFDLETGKTTFADVQAITRRDYQGMMVTIKTSMGREMTVTADHPVILFQPNGFEIVPAIDVAPGDQVMALLKLPAEIVFDLHVDTGNDIDIYETEDKQLADSFVLWLQTQGIIPSIESYLNENTQVVYRILQPVFAGVSQPVSFPMEQDYSILTVQDIEYMPVDTQVYSLETSTGTVTTGTGLVSHNCFPKDVKALANMALTHGMHPQLLNAVMEINDFQRKHIAMKVRDLLDGSVEGKIVGMLGLAFKPNTDDIRDAPALTVARTLINQGGIVRGYDPVAMENVEKELPDIQLVENPYDVAEGANILLVMTEWNEFKQLDMKRVKDLMKEPIIVDGRNIYKPEAMRELGFVYRGVGRGFNGEGVLADGEIASGD
jgi:nucleotide sugar dehydrogenase